MELPALLGHGAELLRIIRKSSQPADLIASEFFRKKKYIGSTERKFISELVFSSLRIYLLSKKISDYALSDIELINKQEDGNSQSLIDEFPIIVTTCIIATEFYKSKPFFQPREIIERLLKKNQENFEEELKTAFTIKLKVGLNDAKNFFDRVKTKFFEYDISSREIINKNKPHTENEINTISIRYSVPGWIISKWINNDIRKIFLNEACQMAESLFYPAPLTVRVNLSKISRDNVMKIFSDNNIACKKGEYSPSAVIFESRVQLNQFDVFKNGLIEVQDEGSQMISLALFPESGVKILDACAGAGGKSLHLADLQNNHGEIYSNDIDNRKLRELKHRALRSGFDSIKIVKISNQELVNEKLKKGFRLLFDIVLVDAPCSGTGTVRRTPMLKWRLNPEQLEGHRRKQLKLLTYYSQFLRDGGVLIYSTCSLMYEENESVVNDFLTQNPQFEPFPLKSAYEKNGVIIRELKDNDYMLNLSPAKHGCDGFFIAKLKRK